MQLTRYSSIFYMNEAFYELFTLESSVYSFPYARKKKLHSFYSKEKNFAYLICILSSFFRKSGAVLSCQRNRQNKCYFRVLQLIWGLYAKIWRGVIIFFFLAQFLGVDFWGILPANVSMTQYVIQDRISSSNSYNMETEIPSSLSFSFFQNSIIFR